jgi:DNA-binding NtrC family response regulator
MPVRVLVADDNLDVHELVNDILLINFKDVTVDRALDIEGLRTRLRAAQRHYNLVIAASSLADGTGKTILSILSNEFPEYLATVVLLEDMPGRVPAGPATANIPILKKPFSLDDFGDCIRRICPR